MRKSRRARSERAGRGQESRDSSVSSSEVRCACQYFQSDSLLPERTAIVLASRPSSRQGAHATMGDHEYEPISPPADTAMEAEVKAEGRRRRSSSEAAGSSVDSAERRFLRAPLQESVSVPGDGDLEDEAMAGRELGDTNNGDDDETDEGHVGAAELQARLEERFLNETPTTTESRTDGEFNTSNVDSSALEDLPLEKGARRKNHQEQQEQVQKKSRAANFQQRIRSQAGKLRTRLSNIKKPTFTMPERPKITLPDRPKFHLPERPKFTLPERPKFNLPQRPKFTMPERPKFTMPERPKINLPQKPKISMPTLSSLSSRTKGRGIFSSTRRPLRDRSANVSTVSTTSSKKKKMFDFDFRTYPRLFDRKTRAKPKGQRAETPPPSTPFRKKGPVGHGWLDRFKDITYADEDAAAPSSSEGTRPAVESQESGELADQEEYVWEDKGEKGLEGDAESVGIQRQDSARTESMTDLKEKDFGFAEPMETPELSSVPKQVASSGSFPESDQEQRSSGSSSDRHRAGVLEEIDSDEFFLRQKGISQEDVVLGRMLTSEIRDAFRSPGVALKQMDSYEYYDDENEAENLAHQYRSTPEREPTRPTRTRSLRPRRRSSRSKESSPTEDQSLAAPFNTFPPTRPKRSRPARSQEVLGDKLDEEGKLEEERQDVVEDQDEIPQEAVRPELQMEESGEVEDVDMEEMAEDSVEEQEVELQEEKEASPAHPEIVITGAQDQELFDEEFPDEDRVDDRSQQWRYENVFPEQPPTTPPTAPRRKKRTLKQSLPDSLCNGSYTKEDWMENVNGHIMPDEIIALRMESEYIIPDVPDEEQFEMPPIAPKRVRRRSKSSRGPSLLEDEDRTSHGASSLPAEEPPPHIDIGDVGGYASVIKPVPVKPERPRRPKPARPPPPGRRKKSNGIKFPHFFSLPRKPPPVRPVRNYSTLGLSRPSRKERYKDQDDPSQPYIEIAGDDLDQQPQEESQDSSRDLQSGVVIEKMKGRPLPPPPRPPRRSKEGRGDVASQFDDEEELELRPADALEEMALAALSDEVFYSHKGSASSLQRERLAPERTEGINTGQQTSLDPEEVTVSTQTDPLMDEYCEDLVDGEPVREHIRAIKVEKITRSPEKEILEESAFYTEEVSVPATKPLFPDDEVIESAVLGRLVCRSEASPESRLVEEEARRSPATARTHTPVREIRTERIIERHIPVQVMPDENSEVEVLRAQRLQVSELDVERLNVGELQAQKILVSDIDGVSMQVAELTSKSGSLVVSGLELPAGFLQELQDFRQAPVTHVIMECSSTQTTAPPEETKLAAEETPRQDSGLAHHEGQTATFPPGSVPSYIAPQFGIHPGMHFVPLGGGYMPGADWAREYTPPMPPPPRVSSRQRPHAQELESEDEVVGVVPSPRRRRHHAKPVSRYSSDEEEEEDAPPQFHASRRHTVRQAPALELARQLLHQLESTAAGRWLRRAWGVVAPGSEERRRDVQTAMCALLVLVAVLILLGFGSGKTFHHHHWDYYFPPPV